MLPPSTVHQIRQLLSQRKLSQRTIARNVGVSRGTVGAIARGRRPDYQARRAWELCAPSGPVVRCPGCGGLVRMPCLLCRLRAMRERDRSDP